MTFPLEFDLLMIGVCTFIKNKKQKQKKNKKKRQKKKMQRYVCVSYLTPSIFVVVGFISGGLSEIFMRDELRESSLRSFVPWIMTDMYLI